MSYLASGQTHRIRMMYGGHPNHESFQEMLQTFGQLVESKVLPAEKKTEMERAQDSVKSLAFQLSQSGKYDRHTPITFFISNGRLALDYHQIPGTPRRLVTFILGIQKLVSDRHRYHPFSTVVTVISLPVPA